MGFKNTLAARDRRNLGGRGLIRQGWPEVKADIIACGSVAELGTMKAPWCWPTLRSVTRGRLDYDLLACFAWLVHIYTLAFCLCSIICNSTKPFASPSQNNPRKPSASQKSSQPSAPDSSRTTTSSSRQITLISYTSHVSTALAVRVRHPGAPDAPAHEAAAQAAAHVRPRHDRHFLPR